MNATLKTWIPAGVAVGALALAAGSWWLMPTTTRAVLKQRLAEAVQGKQLPAVEDDHGPFKVEGASIRVPDSAAERMGLKVKAVTPQSEPVTLTITGKTGLNQETVAHVHAQFPGRIVEVGPVLGTRVRGPGDPEGPPTVLCVIESTDLANAKSAWVQAKVQAEQDADMLRRTDQLVKDGVLSDKSLLDAQVAVRKSAAAKEQARQQLLIFGLTDADLADIETQQGRERMVYRITAPRSGLLIEKNVTRGELADNQTNLFTIADLSTLWVWGDVYERDWSRLKLGQKVKVDVAARPGDPRQAAIEWISPVLDTTTRSVKVRCSLNNSDHLLLSDLFATLTVEIAPQDQAVVLPTSAVVRTFKDHCVFVRTAGGGEGSTYERRTVTAESLDPGRLRITSGLSRGDLVVENGALSLLTEMLDR